MRHEYQEDDVQEILKRAMSVDAQRIQHRDALRMSATELGISDEALAQAEIEYLQEKGEKEELAEFRRERRRGFAEHLLAYVTVNAFLIALNLINWKGHFWAIYPLLGWGIGMAFHVYESFSLNSENFDEEFRRWRKRRHRRQRAASDEDEDESQDEG